MLNRRVRKAEMADAPIIDNVKQTIEAIVARFVAAGMIDDRAFAQTKARSLHRRGTSTRLIRQKLKLAGVDGDTLDEAMAGLDQELDTDPRQREWQAAMDAFYARLDRAAAAPDDRAASSLLDPDSKWNALLGAISNWANGAEIDKVSVRDYG
ncbi:MAG: RecX family transcriptional regulator, partial [Reyranellales bacterium]